MPITYSYEAGPRVNPQPYEPPSVEIRARELARDDAIFLAPKFWEWFCDQWATGAADVDDWLTAAWLGSMPETLKDRICDRYEKQQWREYEQRACNEIEAANED